MQLISRSSRKSSSALPEALPAMAAEPVAPSVALERPDFGIAAVIGTQLSDPIQTMQQIVQAFHQTRKISRSEMQALHAAIELAGQIARQSQQIARLAEGRVRQSHERLKLNEIVHQALDARLPLLGQAAIEVHRSIKPVEIIVDPGLLSSLVETALDWALGLGQRLVVSLGIKNWPEHGVLLIKARPAGPDATATDRAARADNLDWHLLLQLAQAMGVTLERDLSAGEARLVIEFARTVKQLEGLTAVELDASGESLFHGASKPLAGYRILLVTSDASVRAEVQHACRLLGLVVDISPTTAQALRSVELDMPHMLIIDERIRDEPFDALLQDLERRHVDFGLLEISDDANTFEISSWMGSSMSRLSRDGLRAQLPSALTLELAKAF